MEKGCLLGIMKKGMTSYSSSIMLIPRKQGGIPRIVTDFRHLNSRLVVLQPSIPLVRDAIQIIGADSIEVQDTYYKNAKDMYFCAANNNVPIGEDNNEKDNIEGYFSLCFNEESNNKRENFESNEPELNKRYPVTTSIKNVFDPGKFVATTYLWSEESAISENKGIFDMGKIAMKMDSTVQGTLLTPDKTKMEILIDSGAKRALLNREFYYKTPSLHDCPRYRLAKPALIRTPNKTHMVVQECIDLLIKIQGHVFKINAYILPHMDTSYDMILGQKPMYELEAGPDFGHINFYIYEKIFGIGYYKGNCDTT